MWGLPQHVLDMRQILRYVQQDKDLSAYPLFLYGHSWGGYAANAVSCLEGFPGRGLISVAAYNDALAVVRHVSRWRYGRLSSLVIMLFEIYQRIFFGRMSRMTSAQGLQKLTCPMLICHSQDDAIVPYTENFSVIRQRLKGRENVLFMDMNGRNHNITTPPEIDVRQRALIRRLKEQDTEEAKEELWKLQMITDEELMFQFVQFLNTCGTD